MKIWTWKKKYEGFLAYSRSKLALIMFTFDLADELTAKNIIVNAIHPATLMKTNMVSEHFGIPLSSVKKGRKALTALASSKEVTGEFFDGKRRAKALEQAYDIKSREKLKRMTEDHLYNYLKT
ncbi:SDR family NAD(P)-dependent oxidoreductase [Lacicoccus qingdaonensis]|uniref:SDR family NAD(P)-dependent oxidoreductase n=1 Tax=Lacicoccus qingdaonensis TaxID=576118 RepID=UPI001C40B5DE|nr:SDR family NAD(P)-dependent oxidoreductase [Salinicoccus qingdaonensis]